MNLLKAIIVDDEKSARNVLRSKLKKYAEKLEVIQDIGDPEDAIILVRKLKPDILFLDVQMPNLDGFEVLRQLNGFEGEVIFVTAFDEYAIQAFKFCASGYLLKPVINAELDTTLKKLLNRYNPLVGPSSSKRIQNYIHEKEKGINKIYIPSVEGYDFVHLGEIIYLEASDKYTLFHLKSGKRIVSSKSISHFGELLPPESFFQCHRSHIVNLDEIAKYCHEGFLSLSNGIELPISRRRRKSFFAIFGI